MRDFALVAIISATLIVLGFSCSECIKTCAAHCAAGHPGYETGGAVGKCICKGGK